MSQPAGEAPPPYTGRSHVEPTADAGTESTGVSPAGPRVRWRRITLVHLLAGAAAGFAVPTLFFLGSSLILQNIPSYLPILLISAVVVSLVGGGLPLLGAWLTWLAVSRVSRALGREIAAVAGGALAGALPVSLLAGSGLNSWEAIVIAELLFGVPTALGFAIWVWVAWLPKRVRDADGEHSLN